MKNLLLDCLRKRMRMRESCVLMWIGWLRVWISEYQFHLYSCVCMSESSELLNGLKLETLYISFLTLFNVCETTKKSFQLINLSFQPEHVCLWPFCFWVETFSWNLALLLHNMSIFTINATLMLHFNLKWFPSENNVYGSNLMHAFIHFNVKFYYSRYIPFSTKCKKKTKHVYSCLCLFVFT